MYFDKNIKKYDFELRIVFLGKAEIGKTILYKKIELYNDYKQFKILNKTYIPTCGYDFMIIGKKFNGKTYKLQIFDFSGQERFKTILYGHYKITSNYGMRVHPITGVYKLHTGVDISATIGTDFTAIADGVVVKAEPNRAYGNMVIIDHGGGVQTLYAHGSQIVATLGQEVKAGDVVLKVGSTGYSTGPHAHFEVRINGNPVNPLEYVQKPE